MPWIALTLACGARGSRKAPRCRPGWRICPRAAVVAVAAVVVAAVVAAAVVVTAEAVVVVVAMPKAVTEVIVVAEEVVVAAEKRHILPRLRLHPALQPGRPPKPAQLGQPRAVTVA